MWIFFLSILPLPLLGSVAAGHRTIRFLFLFLFLFLFSGRFTFFWFFPGETKKFNNFLRTFWQLFDNFLTTFLTSFLTTFLPTFLTFFYCDGGSHILRKRSLCGSQLPQQIWWNKFYIRCAYFTPNCPWSPNYSVLVGISRLCKVAKRIADGIRGCARR
jgi:hypothetical protein